MNVAWLGLRSVFTGISYYIPPSIIISLFISLFALLIAFKLPDFVQNEVKDLISQRLAPCNSVEQDAALQIALNVGDFVSGIGALYTLWAAILLELWRFESKFHEFIDMVFLVFSLIAGPIAFLFFQLEPLGLPRSDYKRHAGRRINSAIIFMAALLPILSGIESALLQ